MVWLEFLTSAVIIAFVSMQLVKYGDAIGIHTKIGGMFVGALLLAGATSLPELLTTINAVTSGEPNLAAGNLFGSNMFNMLLLAVLDLVHQRRRISRKDASKHALSGSLTLMMMILAVFFIVANLPTRIQLGSLAVGLDGISMILFYLVALSLLRKQSRQHSLANMEDAIPEGLPSLRVSVIGFVVATLILLVTTPWMVRTSVRIADLTGLGTTFIGSTLVAFVTSLPELVTTIAAGRVGADDMAVANLYGSNMFNMFSIGIADFFLLSQRFFAVIDPTFLLIALLGLLMTVFSLIGNLARLERKVLFIEIDALVLILAYFCGIALLYTRGLMP